MVKKFAAAITALESSPVAPLVQFVKFGLVGVSNTLISYGIEMAGYYWILRTVPWQEANKILVVTAIAFVVSVTNSYFWNSRFVFASKQRRSMGQRIRTFIKTSACYGLTGLVLAPALKIYLEKQGIPYWACSLLALFVTIPLNFILNKMWAFSKKEPRPAQQREQSI